ncbi:hypothetical protein [Salinibaculum rarum]|uniref:hypothetical protein n=1 Tax=Salinibaculum rarum TaxID=3058903 RepID=UPI00265ED498|nr:hypothetical protein [Salinibaculum sp. KK48]
MPSTRRTVLASLGTALVSAGCLVSAEDRSDSPGDDPNANTPAREPDGPYSDGPTARGRFADEPCPSFAETDRTVCAHSRGDSDIYLESSSEVFRPDPSTDSVESLTFTLCNDHDRPFRFNPHAWQLYDKENGEWSLVAPEVYIEPVSEIPPGGSYEWVLSRQPRPGASADDWLDVTVDVTPGRKAFTVDGWFGTAGEGAETHSVECLALFDVVDIVEG